MDTRLINSDKATKRLVSDLVDVCTLETHNIDRFIHAAKWQL
jgi:hypothetical protein